MSSSEIVLRQRYSLSFFTTTLVIALTTQSSLAFSISPINVNPRDTEASYTLPDQRKGITTWNPLNFKIIPRGGTVGFLERLGQDFKTWTFNPAPNDLAGSFRVTEYVAIGTPTSVGARLQLQYDPSNGDPTPVNNSLHWIQRVWNNHSAATDVHGDNADIIDIGVGVDTPFYDTPTIIDIIRGEILEEGKFSDETTRSDSDRDHNWLAELYLVDLTAPKQVTIYNGIQWGWQNRVEPVPEPLTIFAAGVSLGFGALFKKTVKGTGQNKTKSLQKVKD